MPPPNIPERIHHVSNALVTLISSRDRPVPKSPQRIVEIYSTIINCFSDAWGWIYRWYQSVAISVAEEFKLVEIVLIAAANIAATNNPVIPGGSIFPIKYGNTLSPISSSFNKEERS